jgi:ubiquitin carboxyl-terminal hydrolase 12/46
MGGQNSKLQGELTKAFPEGWDDHDRVGIFGFENYGNTCYCNSVLQALYFCKPFREHVCAYRPEWLAPGEEEGAGDVTLLSTLRDLFVQMCKKSTDKKDKGPRVGTLGPKQFVIKLKQDNVMFEGLTQQDAHEFFNYVINDISDQLLRDRKRAKERRAAGELPPLPGEEDTEEDLGVGAQPPKPKPTWVQEIFGGVLTNEVRCINCECVTSRQEQILDLSLDIEQVGAPFARSHRPQRQPHAHEMLR